MQFAIFRNKVLNVGDRAPAYLSSDSVDIVSSTLGEGLGLMFNLGIATSLGERKF